MERTHRTGSYAIRVRAKLSQLKGNARPYFSITADQWDEHGHASSGCLHDEILAVWPDLAPLVALHLSDDDGVPMHAEANGYYQLAGCFADGLGQRYHAGNADTYGRPRNCLGVFAQHCRITREEAQAIVNDVHATLGPNDEPHSVADYKRARARWTVLCDAMRPRWKTEADAARAAFGLEVEVE